MNLIKKAIKLSRHAEEQAGYRGCSEKEIKEAVQTSAWEPADLGKLQCRKDFIHNQEWNGKEYRTKQVRPIFAEDENKIIVITVYVYYF